MKKYLLLFVIVLLLCGCGKKEEYDWASGFENAVKIEKEICRKNGIMGKAIQCRGQMKIGDLFFFTCDEGIYLVEDFCEDNPRCIIVKRMLNKDGTVPEEGTFRGFSAYGNCHAPINGSGFYKLSDELKEKCKNAGLGENK